MQVGDQFPIEDLGLAKGDGPAVVYFYSQPSSDSWRKLMDEIRSPVEGVVERSTTPT